MDAEAHEGSLRAVASGGIAPGGRAWVGASPKEWPIVIFWIIFFSASNTSSASL